MIELPLILVGGLLGSAHCLGMCGPLAISLSAGASADSNPLTRQLLFSLGRVFTYGFCGAAAGLGGAWISSESRSFVLSQACLAILAGAVLLLMGLVTAGVLPRPAFQRLGTLPCGAAGWLKTFLTAPGRNGGARGGSIYWFYTVWIGVCFFVEGWQLGKYGARLVDDGCVRIGNDTANGSGGLWRTVSFGCGPVAPVSRCRLVHCAYGIDFNRPWRCTNSNPGSTWLRHRARFVSRKKLNDV